MFLETFFGKMFLETFVKNNKQSYAPCICTIPQLSQSRAGVLMNTNKISYKKLAEKHLRAILQSLTKTLGF